MALRISSAVALALTISPLRTPRERAWPRPMMLRAPWSLISPMTAQILDVPMSNPTMTGDELNMFFPGFKALGKEWRAGGKIVGGRLGPARRNEIANGQIQRGEDAILGAPIFQRRL